MQRAAMLASPRANATVLAAGSPPPAKEASTCELSQRLGLDSIDMYIARRQLRWLGHVARMDYDRLPRRMLSAWVPHRRPIGAPRMTSA